MHQIFFMRELKCNEKVAEEYC